MKAAKPAKKGKKLAVKRLTKTKTLSLRPLARVM